MTKDERILVADALNAMVAHQFTLAKLAIELASRNPDDVLARTVIEASQKAIVASDHVLRFTHWAKTGETLR